MDVDEAIQTRRTHKQFSAGSLSRETIVELLELAIWAPNHHITEPWRFAVVEGDSKQAMIRACHEAFDAMAKPGDDRLKAKLSAKKNKFARRIGDAGAVLLVSYVRSDSDPTQDREDYAATACAVQNIQLGATARGLVSQWSTSKVFCSERMRAFFGQQAEETLVSVLFVGRPLRTLPGRRERSVEQFTRWL
jgi:nitroreductase